MTTNFWTLDRLFVEIALYLEIRDLLAEPDFLWTEYCAWKRLTDARAKVSP